MIVFEWFYDKNEIIVNELEQLENYKVFFVTIVVLATCIYLQCIATGSCCEELNNGSGCMLSCKTTRERSV